MKDSWYRVIFQTSVCQQIIYVKDYNEADRFAVALRNGMKIKVQVDKRNGSNWKSWDIVESLSD